MDTPVTTLASIVTLAQQQYGIRFQLTNQQLVNFVNMIQYIAYNKDVDAFVEYEQTLTLGIDCYLETTGSYVSPSNSDIGKNISGSSSGVIGTLLNFSTLNRVNKWIIAPPDGVTSLALVDGEILTIVAGTGGTGVIVEGQGYPVSLGPYRTPETAFGNPPFRKLIGITQVTDKQMFHVPPGNSYSGYDDYGLLLNSLPGRRQNFPFRYNIAKQEVTLIASSSPEITTSPLPFGTGSTVINTSSLRWLYYKNPPAITSITQESNLILPENYRYEIVYKGISLLADVATYGESGTIRKLIEPLCERFWEDMRDQYQQYGRGSDYISHGDTWDYYGLGLNGGRNTFLNGNNGVWN